MYVVYHDDAMAWKLFPHYRSFVRRIYQSPVDKHRNCLVMQSFDLFFVLAWTGFWTNSRCTCHLGRHNAIVTLLIIVVLDDYCSSRWILGDHLFIVFRTESLAPRRLRDGFSSSALRVLTPLTTSPIPTPEIANPVHNSWDGVFMHVPWLRHQMETFPRYCPFLRGIHRSPVNSPHTGQWRTALIFSLIYAWINGWVNNLRRHRAHYDVIVMQYQAITKKC